ncbi:MAG: immunoglobulin domain-containing protein [Phycisphaerales bacterium]
MYARSGIPSVWNGSVSEALDSPTLPNFSTHATQNAFTLPSGYPALVGEFVAGSTAPNNAGTLRVMRIDNGVYTIFPGRLAPSSRSFASIAAYPTRGAMLVGGSTDTSGNCTSGTPSAAYFGDTWLLRGERWQLLAAGGIGAPYNSPLVYDPAEGTMVFPVNCSVRAAGTSVRSARWDGSAWQPWTFATNPQPGSGGYNANAVDPASGRAWVLTQNVNSLTARNAGAAAWSSLGAPAGAPFQSYGTMAFDPIRNALVHTGQSTADSTRAFNVATGTWSIIQNSPASGSTPYPGRWAPGSTYDPGRGAVVVFGGFNHHDSSQPAFPRRTYVLPSGSNAWQQIITTNVPGRKFMNLAYEPLSERIVMFGGDNFNMMGDTWKLARGPAGVAVPPAHVTADADATATFEIVAKGGGAIRYQRRRNGVPLAENARIDGVHTDLLTITGLRAFDAGDYTCTVTNDCGTQTSAAAHLTVNGAVCAADLGSAGGTPGPDGSLNNNDFIAFITHFFNADAQADMGTTGGLPGSDGAFNNNDFIAFINAFFTGC